jgi:hypothetical protein
MRIHLTTDDPTNADWGQSLVEALRGKPARARRPSFDSAR